MTAGSAPGPGRGQRGVRRYHFHAPGLLYIGVTFFLAVGAINSQNNLLFAALGLAIGGLLVSGIISGASLLGLRVERDPIARAAAGSPLTVSYTITNSNRMFPAFGLHVVEVPSGGDHGWERLMPGPRAFVALVGTRRSARAHATLVPTRRGQAAFNRVRIWTTFPFGLTRKSVTFDLPATAVVRPVDLPLRREVLEELSAPASHGDGAERMPGHGDEFFALREYAPGDSPRRIAWRRSARTGDLVVRQQALPAPLRLWVVLWAHRTDGSTADGPDLERAVALAAAVVRNAAATGMAVGLIAPGAARPPRIGHRHVDQLICDLALTNGSGAVEPPAAFGRAGASLVISAGGPPPPGLAMRGRTLPAPALASLLIPGLSDAPLALLAHARATAGTAEPTPKGAAA